MRSIRIGLIVHLLLVVRFSVAQPPNVLWSRIYGGEASDLFYDVQLTDDGGLIFAGESASFNFENYDAYVVRTNGNGDTLWTHTYGGDLNDGAGIIRPTADGGWILAGSTESSGAGNSDMWLVKIGANGSHQWDHTYGGAGFDYGTGAEQTADGGYILCGYSRATSFGYPDARLIKTDGSGVQQWSRTFGGPDNQEVFYDARQLPGRGYILCGYNDDFNGNGGWDAWVVRTDSMGQNATSRLYGGFGYEGASSIVRTADGGFCLAGFTDRDYSIANDFYFARLDANLDTLWTRNWGRPFVDEAWDLIQTSDGGFLATGYTCIPQFGECRYDLYLVKIAANGDSLWTWQFGVLLQNDAAFASRQTADGGYIVASYNTSPDVIDYDALAVRLEGGCADPTPRAPTGFSAHSFGNDIRLIWQPVTQSVADCPITISDYTVFSDTVVNGSFEIVVGNTADTVFTHVGAVSSSQRKFYQVTATGQ